MHNRLINPPFANVYLTSNFTVSTGVWTEVPFDEVENDTHGWVDFVSTPNRIKVSEDGLYGITGQERWGTSTSGIRALALKRNDETINMVYQTPVSGRQAVVPAYRELLLDAGDEIWIDSLQESGGNLSLVGSSEFYTLLSVRWLGK